ncbi:transposase [Fusarium langsethiae]|nr:transposase [Fusarium langsethiae]
MSAVDVQTPKSSRDLVKLQRSLMAVDPAFGQSAARLLFRKVGKALDDNIVKLTAAEVQTDHLTNALEKARPQKRRRVIPDPNKDFVELHEVQTEKARLAAEGGGESDIHSDLEGSTLSDSGSEKSSEAEDCIEVRNPDFEST